MLFCQGGTRGVWLLCWPSAWAAGQVSGTLCCWVAYDACILRTGAQGVVFLLWPVVWPSTLLLPRHPNSVAPSVGSLVTHSPGWRGDGAGGEAGVIQVLTLLLLSFLVASLCSSLNCVTDRDKSWDLNVCLSSQWVTGCRSVWHPTEVKLTEL